MSQNLPHHYHQVSPTFTSSSTLLMEPFVAPLLATPSWPRQFGNLTRSVSSATATSGSEHSSSTKRGRDSFSESTVDGDDDDMFDEDFSDVVPSACYVVEEGTMKKTRQNSYVAPRKVSDSFLSAMGSIAAASTATTNALTKDANQDSATAMNRVPVRRQLSASKLDPFLSFTSRQDSFHGNVAGNDCSNMDVDESTRPRSMSF
ncbi:hypothetical protein MPSEU_000359300 [Mayamaea pseudoterrestris]|nr:hypothetical protein MPSEU_000359300 [Mayamaea pseudoterrestris]